MSFTELILLAIGLSMDAFAVSVCAGLSMPKATVKKSLTVGLYFGVFQAVMPLIGYAAATRFADKINAFDHWIAFALLAFIGAKMIIESQKKDDNTYMEEADLSPAKMIPLALATSIDALAVGISFAFLQVNILAAVLFIGATTLSLSMLGVKTGKVFGAKYRAKAALAGGAILVLIGLKILLEHSGIITL